ncbi:hypothetical protein [uncultured Thioclava sp.]|jgi:hypothetical protein|uniref:Glyceraldehyde-3-phosphate dehydrogenase n=1 Tax=Thioclava arctica TaxID=3238301 RepID=A0ABV3TG65_9RHOB|nr:hypothetical protein [uncultured Thioclava sp.]
MTDRIALWLGAILIVLILADIFLNQGQALLFLGRRIADLVQYVAFWR